MPCVVDLATMREAVVDLGGDPSRINPLAPAELVIDHSVITDVFGRADALRAQHRVRVPAQPRALPVPALGPDRVRRVQGRSARHRHRAPGQPRVPGAGRDGAPPRWRSGGIAQAYPDTCVGTDSHTTMVNGLGVLGWGVGGIEAEAAMLGQPVSMLIPRVVGFKLTGEIPAGRHGDRRRAHDHPAAAQARRGGQVRRVLRRGRGGRAAREPGHDRQHEPRVRLHLRDLPDRRRHARVPAADRPRRRAARAGRGIRQGAGPLARPGPRGALLRVPRARPVHRRPEHRRPEASAGPGPAVRGEAGLPRGAARLRRRDDHATASATASTRRRPSPSRPATPRPSATPRAGPAPPEPARTPAATAGRPSRSPSGWPTAASSSSTTAPSSISSITSCTNTSNPSVMIGAGLLAKKAVERGLTVKPWVKTSLAPGQQGRHELLRPGRA